MLLSFYIFLKDSFFDGRFACEIKSYVSQNKLNFDEMKFGQAFGYCKDSDSFNNLLNVAFIFFANLFAAIFSIIGVIMNINSLKSNTNAFFQIYFFKYS